MLHEVGQLHRVCLWSRRTGFNSCITDFLSPFEVALGAVKIFVNTSSHLYQLF